MNYKVGDIVKFERTTTRDDWKIYLIKDNLYYNEVIDYLISVYYIG